jgi:hypothetical protein
VNAAPDRTLTAEIETVLDAGPVRGADAWHLACALYLSPAPRELAFLTMDRQQARVAEALGLPITSDCHLQLPGKIDRRVPDFNERES